jgi:hypothetical protein
MILEEYPGLVDPQAGSKSDFYNPPSTKLKSIEASLLLVLINENLL